MSWQFITPLSEADKGVCDAPWRGNLCLFVFNQRENMFHPLSPRSGSRCLQKEEEQGVPLLDDTGFPSQGQCKLMDRLPSPGPLGCVQALPARPRCQSCRAAPSCPHQHNCPTLGNLCLPSVTWSPLCLLCFSPQTAHLTKYELLKRNPSGTEPSNLGSGEVNVHAQNERKEEQLWDKQWDFF